MQDVTEHVESLGYTGQTPVQVVDGYKVVTHELPFGISISNHQGEASISSSLAQQFRLEDGTDIENAVGQGAADGMESLILALAAEGFNVSGGSFIRGLETAVASTGQQL
jgi:hypothetical protein